LGYDLPVLLSRRLPAWLFLTVTLVAIVVVAVPLGRVLSLEASGAINPDVVMYLIVGRALLNDQRPYVDLFETNCPSITCSFSSAGTKPIKNQLAIR
jgi:hypothetical protein